MASRATHTEAATKARKAAIRSIRDRALRFQAAYLTRLRETMDSLQPLLDEDDPEAVRLARAVEAEIMHIRHGTAIVDE